MMADWASRWRKETSHPKKKLSRGHLSNWICSSTGEGSIFFILRIQTPPPTTVGSSKSHFSLSPKLDLFLLLPPLSQFYFLSRSRSFSSSLFWGEMASRRLLEIHPSLPPVIVALLRPIAFKLGGGGGFLSGSVGATVSRPPPKKDSVRRRRKSGGRISLEISFSFSSSFFAQNGLAYTPFSGKYTHTS